MLVMSEASVAVEVPCSTPAITDVRARMARPSIVPQRAPPAVAWNSSLASHDLSLLLSIIEGQVLPHLIAEYSPAKQSPLGTPLKRRR